MAGLVAVKALTPTATLAAATAALAATTTVGAAAAPTASESAAAVSAATTIAAAAAAPATTEAALSAGLPAALGWPIGPLEEATSLGAPIRARPELPPLVVALLDDRPLH